MYKETFTLTSPSEVVDADSFLAQSGLSGDDMSHYFTRVYDVMMRMIALAEYDTTWSMDRWRSGINPFYHHSCNLWVPGEHSLNLVVEEYYGKPQYLCTPFGGIDFGAGIDMDSKWRKLFKEEFGMTPLLGQRTYVGQRR